MKRAIKFSFIGIVFLFLSGSVFAAPRSSDEISQRFSYHVDKNVGRYISGFGLDDINYFEITDMEYRSGSDLFLILSTKTTRSSAINFSIGTPIQGCHAKMSVPLNVIDNTITTPITGYKLNFGAGCPFPAMQLVVTGDVANGYNLTVQQ